MFRLSFMSKSYKGYQAWSKWQDYPSYNEWKNNCNCHINQTKLPGPMKTASAMTIFKRSLDKNNLRYVSYVDDGDTLSFNEVKNSKPYGDFGIIKKEWVRHVQKRFKENNWDSLNNFERQIFLSDGKKISNSGKLDEKVINTHETHKYIEKLLGHGNMPEQ